MIEDRRYLVSVVLVSLMTCSIPALADVVDLGASKDNTLYEESATTSNGAGVYMFAGNNDNASTRRAVIAFDLSSIPAGSTINSVFLQLQMTRTKAGTTTVTLHRLLADWGEGGSNAGGQEGGGADAQLDDATWRYRFYDPDNVPGSPQWSTQGGDFVAGSSASTSVSGNGIYMWSSSTMADDVQAWLDGTAGNYGWIVRGGESGSKTAKRFNSRQNTDSASRPKLSIDFTPPAGACCEPGEICSELTPEDCNTQGGIFQGGGTTCTPNPCVEPTGACCFAGDGSCTELSSTNCAGQGGSYQGDGTTCTPNPCPQPTGACCLDTDPWSCDDTGTEADCIGSGGTWQGNNTLCTSTDCPVVLEPYVDALPVPPVAQPVSGAVGGTATYHIVMQEFQQKLHRDLPDTTVWGYGDAPDPFDPAVTYGTYLGPTIIARRGFPVTVRYFNELRDSSLGGSPPPYRGSHYLPVDTCAHGADDASPRAVVHLHGGHVPASVDGYPEATQLPGFEAGICVTDPALPCANDPDCPTPGQCDGDESACSSDVDCVGHGGLENCLLCEPSAYVYPNDQQASLIWFHDHALGITRLNVYMGLAAAYIVRDDVEDSLNLPAGEYEVPLVIQDRSFNPDGTLRYHDQWVENFFGDKALVNGKVWPFHDVKQATYRLRLLNGSNSRRYTLSFDRTDLPGTKDISFDVIGEDGGLLEAPVTLDEITLGPAERADVIIDFSTLAAGTEIILANSAVVPGQPDLPEIMKFVVQGVSGPTYSVPSSLTTLEFLDPADAVRTREFLLRKGDEPCTGQAWFIRSRNEFGVDVGERWDDITEFPQLGSTEIWEFANPTLIPHPMHMHLVFFQILNRQDFEIIDDQIVPTGVPVPPAPEEAGWKDTARAEPGKILRVIVRFEDYIGKYAYHCHILEHEDHEMMRQFHTVGPVTMTADATNLNWDAAVGATGYDVLRGELIPLRSTGGDFADPSLNLTCLVNGLLTLTTPHAGNPLQDEGFFYLIRFRDAIGKGTYDSGYSSQADLRDGEIASSGNDCP